MDGGCFLKKKERSRLTSLTSIGIVHLDLALGKLQGLACLPLPFFMIKMECGIVPYFQLS